ncbi:Insulin-like growth factor 2 mRNA-binding protein 1 [Mucor velutinosus]|uniref:Insulin-like growth factor 2 mRNA-binding protein 1 n=1 Tax=Mucor velutinosus TaxID=708070 RepID=A0AAN7HSG2_9FUNG|nr:Insulin-like growth factor 2 mRNA-binding protein 1 [Mucor velutinosus]
MSEKYKTLKVKELQELLQKNDLSTTGKKEDLIARLVKDDERKALENLEKEFELDGDFDESKINLSDIPTDDIFALEKLPLIEKESVLSDDDDDVDLIFENKRPSKSKTTAASSTSMSAVISPVTSTTLVGAKTAESIVKQTETAKQTAPISSTTSNTNTTTTTTTTTAKATVSSSFKFTPITFDKKLSITSAPVATKPAVTAPLTPKTTPAAAKPAPAPAKTLDDKAEKLRLEAERRLERSKRFGVKLDEKEMKEIRAARFGIQPATNATPATATSTKASKLTTQATPKSKETSIKDDGNKKKAPVDRQQELLKKRAERFGMSKNKEEEKETPAKRANNKRRKKATSATSAKESPVKTVQNGRVTKPKLTTPIVVSKNNSNNKNITVNVTKNTVLNKKQKNVNMLNKEGIISQNKKNIINQRKVNMANINNTNSKTAPIVNNGRVITIAPKNTNTALAPAPSNTLKRKRNESQTAPVSNGRSVVINPDLHPNQRKVTIAPAPPVAAVITPKATQNGRSRNSNNSATRKRGPGSRQRNKSNSNQPVPSPVVATPQTQRRNKRSRQH